MRSRLHLPLALALAALIVTAAAACGGDDDGSEPAAQKQTTAAPAGERKPAAMPEYSGAVANPPKQAPALRLEDSKGRPFDIAEHRGKVVLLTWLYVKCPDVCPLIVSNLKAAQAKLGAKAKDLVIVAVSTDPERDTPKAVNRFLEARGMEDRMQYLVGSPSKLQDVWKTWGVTAGPAAANPALIEHWSGTYGISASGKITTLYPANFKPDQIVNDVPLLAQQ